MDQNKPSLVTVAFSLLGAILVATFGILRGVIDFLIEGNGTQTAIGQGVMYIIVSALVLIGTAFLYVGEYKNNRDSRLTGLLINCIGLTVLLLLESMSSVEVSVFPAIVFFACSVIKVINLFVDKKALRIVTLILSSVTLFFLVVAGFTGLYAYSFHFFYVGFLFGYLFTGLALFVSALFDLVKKKAE